MYLLGIRNLRRWISSQHIIFPSYNMARPIYKLYSAYLVIPSYKLIIYVDILTLGKIDCIF